MDAADAEAFQRDGYLLCRGMWPPAAVRPIRAAVARLLAGGVGPSGVRVLAPQAAPADLLRVCTEDPLRSAVRTIIGPQAVFLSVKPVVKTAAITTASPWHQDWPYWRGVHKVSAWIALDPAQVDNGCLRVVPGSHARALAHQRHHVPGGFGNRVSEDAVVAEFGQAALRSVPMLPGDVLFFHDLLLHSSHPNVSGRDRWALIPTYRDSSTADDHTVGELWRAPVAL